MKLQVGRGLHTSFHTGRIKNCCYLALKKKSIYKQVDMTFDVLILELFECSIQT